MIDRGGGSKRFSADAALFYELFPPAELGEAVAAFQFAAAFVRACALMTDFTGEQLHRFPANFACDRDMMLFSVFFVFRAELDKLLPPPFRAAFRPPARRPFV